MKQLKLKQLFLATFFLISAQSVFAANNEGLEINNKSLNLAKLENSSQIECIIHKGDTLSEIAEHFLYYSHYSSIYGGKTSQGYVDALAQINKLKNKDLIYTGNKLAIIVKDQDPHPSCPKLDTHLAEHKQRKVMAANVPLPDQKQNAKLPVASSIEEELVPKPIVETFNKPKSLEKEVKTVSSTIDLYPWTNFDFYWGISSTRESHGGKIFTDGSTLSTSYFGGDLRIWLPFYLSFDVGVHSVPFIISAISNAPDKTAEWLIYHANVQYAVIRNNSLSFVLGTGIITHHSPLQFFDSTTGIMLHSSRTLFNIQVGSEVTFILFNTFWVSINAFIEYPLGHSASGITKITKLTWRLMGNAAFKLGVVFGKLGLGVKVSANYLSSSLLLTNAVTTQTGNDELYNLNVSLFLRMQPF